MISYFYMSTLFAKCFLVGVPISIFNSLLCFITRFKERYQGREMVKSDLEVQNKRVNLSFFVRDFYPIFYNTGQLSFATVPFPKCILPVGIHSLPSPAFKGMNFLPPGAFFFPLKVKLFSEKRQSNFKTVKREKMFIR